MKAHLPLIIMTGLVTTLGCSSKSTTAGTLQIGALLPYSGNLASIGTIYEDGIQAAIYMFNQNGGIHGQKVELVTQDTNSVPANPNLAVTAAQTLLPKTNVKAFLGPIQSSQYIALASWAQENEVVILSPTAAQDAVDNYASNQYLWHSISELRNRDKVLALDMNSLGVASVVVIQSSGAAAADLPTVLGGALHNLNSASTVTTVTYPQLSDYSKWDASSTVAQALATTPAPTGIVINGDTSTDGAAVITALKNQSYSGVIHMGFSSGQGPELAGLNISSGIRTIYSLPPSAADVQAFQTVYTAWNNGTASDGDEDQSFDSATWLMLAIEKANSTEGSDIVAALPKIVAADGTSIGPTDISTAYSLIAAGKDLQWRGSTDSFLLDPNTHAPITGFEVLQCCATTTGTNAPYINSAVATYLPGQY